MRATAVLTAVGAALALAASALSGATLPASGAEPALAPGVTAWFRMDEAPGTTVMTDSGPNGLSAPVDPTGVTSGSRFDGATGYSWSRRAPEAYPPSPERVRTRAFAAVAAGTTLDTAIPLHGGEGPPSRTSVVSVARRSSAVRRSAARTPRAGRDHGDRKSTRLNSSHRT